jgi:dihydroxyacetone kinase
MDITGHDLNLGLARVAAALEAHAEALGDLDRTIGDGDLGITARKIAAALHQLPDYRDASDLGAELMRAAMAINKVASSSFGTLLAGAVLAAGKVVRGQQHLSPNDLARMLEAADVALQERGNAKPGDKTMIDAIHPAAVALRGALDQGASPEGAMLAMVRAARAGRDAVTPLRNRIGRASWIGERTEGVVDPGAHAAVIIVEALAQRTYEALG